MAKSILGGKESEVLYEEIGKYARFFLSPV
jgi:hypothetical protein